MLPDPFFWYGLAFKAVMTGTKWASLVVAVGVLFFTLLFCTQTGFMSALISAAVLAVLGGVFLRERPAAPAR